MRLSRSGLEVDAWLDAFRRQGDPLADAAAAELMRRGGMRRDPVEALEGAGPACRALLEHACTVPRWADFEAMRPGSQLGLRTPVQSALSLILGSLMESYASAKGAKVLVRGGKLKSQVIARLHDTTSFVLEIAASRGPKPGTKAHRHILRTRLVHAFIRRAMATREDWDAAWGDPVNQEDYASTLLAFSHVYLRSLQTLGVAVSDEESASIHHLWRWVGHVMGVHPELLTADRTEERVLYTHIARRQLHPDDDSRALAHALIGALDRRAPIFLPAEALAEMTRDMLGDAMGDALALPHAPRWAAVGERALPWLCAVQRAVERLPLTRAPLELVGEHVARAVYKYGLRA
jgi:hypothetical protein